MPKHPKLTEADWRKVFEIRCRSKRGQGVTDTEWPLLEAAFKQDPKRYADMNADVFDATIPIGSNVKAKR